ncbi:MAG: hypothetical protein A2214_01115 [Candidatus Harrisonbacteria bacterium RIFOXYA1_FULL_48_8]|uniref:Uncharacterized protein n=1 Tax=Candidatus Harrisonbacteria bacterium RIFOXYA1_FULL_48_8 TaxID=1798411 RepID=A0A1G1ZYB8_9BACT|nr:MAG: hypothetical protein A2214_01115 [Candidatus Harrisonbacteria bacterium RIFOXYA1_FULL_48_8]
MKIALAILLAISFVGIASFSVFTMSHGAEHNGIGCVAAAAQGIDCPKAGSLFSFLAIHLNAFHIVSAAVFFVLAIGLGIVWKFQFSPPFVQSVALRYFSKRLFQQRLTRWLALHENSPAIL